MRPERRKVRGLSMSPLSSRQKKGRKAETHGRRRLDTQKRVLFRNLEVLNFLERMNLWRWKKRGARGERTSGEGTKRKEQCNFGEMRNREIHRTARREKG
uniref:Uncharacterized protein n=1 Tax=Toxoplasma gondii COUG TaxID=1074873 RepID=A0A2G8XZ07_TOXGO|nr:hypothetical protein TGCOUG_285880 [Toxoplasma gondii COUG]